MKNIITAIIIDKEYHDYSEIKTNNRFPQENKLNIISLKSDTDLYLNINNFIDIDCIITIGNLNEFKLLNHSPYYFRKKWVHFDIYDSSKIANTVINVFKNNIERQINVKTFSVFTCTYNTSYEKLNRLYKSLLSQTYNEWNWFIIDDSLNNNTISLINDLHDPRITVIRNVTNHGNIGFNKHTIAMMCNGDYLVEVDHDDELLPYCLEYLKNAFDEFPDAGFAYSAALELKGQQKIPIVYSKGWGFGEGLTTIQNINGKTYQYSETPGINPFSIRTIYAQPNHVRCWRKETYHMLNGHNCELTVLDDMDLLIRTFLHTRMIKIPKVLYIQYEGDGERGKSTENTQSLRYHEIQRTVWILKSRYDQLIHDRIIELGYKDIPWVEEYNYSDLNMKHTPGQEIMSYEYIK